MQQRLADTPSWCGDIEAGTWGDSPLRRRIVFLKATNEEGRTLRGDPPKIRVMRLSRLTVSRKPTFDSSILDIRRDFGAARDPKFWPTRVTYGGVSNGLQ
jgi:hypothetical protein